MSEANYEPDTSEVSQCDCRAFFVTRERGSNPPRIFFCDQYEPRAGIEPAT